MATMVLTCTQGSTMVEIPQGEEMVEEAQAWVSSEYRSSNREITDLYNLLEEG
jgi:hypothetical protein